MDQDREFTREPIGRFEWERILRRIQVSAPSVKLVGFTMATYASADGGNVRPGQARLAAVMGASISTVRRGQAELEGIGMLDMVTKGRSFGRGHIGSFASEYRLTVPSDLLERVTMLDPDEQNNQAPMHGTYENNRAPVTRSSEELPVISEELPVTSEELPVIWAKEPVTHERPPQHPHHNTDQNKEHQSLSVAQADAHAREPKQEEIEIDLPEVEKPISKAALEKQIAEDFNAWYAIYPKRQGRGAAVNAYGRARKKATAEELASGATRYAVERKGQDPQFTKAPATWLNQECWADEPAPVDASGPWDPAFHANPNVPRQYAWANRPDHGDRALAKGRAMLEALEAGEGAISQSRTAPSRYPDGSQRRLQKGYELLVQTRAEQEASTSDIAAEFDEWFAAYPRHEGLADAQHAYTEARKAATAEQLLAGAQRYAADPNRDPQYTKLPANWLAGKGWQDSPLPLRRTGTSEDRMRANLQVLDGWSPGQRVDVFEQKALGQ